MSLALSAYRLASRFLEKAGPRVLADRVKKGKEDPVRIGERLGKTGVARPDGKLVWLHGVSIGETLSLLALVERIRAERPDIAILVTSGTVTSASLLAKRLPAGVIHQYAPIDGPAAVKRFMEHWRPDLGILVESDLWPNLLLAAKKSDAKLALVSARLTERAAKGWLKRPAAARRLLGLFDLILPQDEETAQRMALLGVTTGPLLNLKLAGAPLPHDEAELKRLRTLTKGRKVVLAASTHPGEDEMIAAATPPGALLIIAPRHPNRGPEIAGALQEGGRKVARRAAGEKLANNTDVYIADTLGEIGLFMRLADLVVLGGSLVPDIGGHNPLEPARLGAPTLSGPYVHKNAALFDDMADAGALLIIEPEDLKSEIARLLDDAATSTALAKAASAYVDRQAGAFEAGWALIRPLLPA